MGSSLAFQRDVGPGVLLSLIGGALRLDRKTFENAAAPEGRTRLHLAVALVAAIASAFAAAMAAVGAGLMRDDEVALYRVFVFGWAVAVLVQLVLSATAVWGIRAIARRPPVPFRALLRLLALSLAPMCLLFVGPLVGQPEIVTGLVAVWRWMIAVTALRVGTDASWLGALATVVIADLIASPITSLLMLGIR